MSNPTAVAPASRRLTSPTFSPEDVEKIRQAAKKDGRSVSNFIAVAATRAAERLLSNRED